MKKMIKKVIAPVLVMSVSDVIIMNRGGRLTA